MFKAWWRQWLAKPKVGGGGVVHECVFHDCFLVLKLHGPAKLTSTTLHRCSPKHSQYSKSCVCMCNLRFQICSLCCHSTSRTHSALTPFFVLCSSSYASSVYLSIFCVFVFNIPLWGLCIFYIYAGTWLHFKTMGFSPLLTNSKWKVCY